MDLTSLQTAVTTLTGKVDTLIALTDKLKSDLTDLLNSTSDPGTASAINAMIDQINAESAKIDTTLTNDADPVTDPASTGTSATPAAPASTDPASTGTSATSAAPASTDPSPTPAAPPSGS